MSPPFDGFVKRLCETEGLVDIGPLGTARQSSLSRWSRPEDAQRATWSVKADFAFHTDKEDEPWWRITFPTPRSLKYIVLHNRRTKRLQDLCHHVRVSISEEEEQWQQIYDGAEPYGAEPHELPLLVAVPNGLKARAVEVRLNRAGHLHLSHIQILADGRQSRDLTVFVSDRHDGLGERLRSILNGMALASYFGANFRFYWPPIAKVAASFHAVDEVNEIFSESFIQRYGMTADCWRALSLAQLNGPPFNKYALSDENIAPLHGFSVGQSLPAGPGTQGLFQWIRSSGEQLSLRFLFERIQFSDAVQEAIASANAIDGAVDATAIHLRAGDIIYGPQRYSGFFVLKAIPYPLVIEIVRKIKGIGRNVILFGQDNELCQLIATECRITYAGTIVKERSFSTVQAALFEIVLMSRCTEIVAGTSGFARAAGLIGGSTISGPEKYYSKDGLADLIRRICDAYAKSGAPVSKLQQAFSYWWSFVMLGPSAPPRERMDLIERASYYDPTNPLYSFVLAIFTYQYVDVNEGEQAIFRLFSSIGDYPEYNILNVLSDILLDRSTPSRPYLEALSQSANAGLPMAALCVAISERALGRPDTALRYATIHRETRTPSQTKFDRYL